MKLLWSILVGAPIRFTISLMMIFGISSSYQSQTHSHLSNAGRRTSRIIVSMFCRQYGYSIMQMLDTTPAICAYPSYGFVQTHRIICNVEDCQTLYRIYSMSMVHDPWGLLAGRLLDWDQRMPDHLKNLYEWSCSAKWGMLMVCFSPPAFKWPRYLILYCILWLSW